MSQFRNAATGVVVTVDDSKDGRFGGGWEPVQDKKSAPAKASARKTSTSKSDK